MRYFEKPPFKNETLLLGMVNLQLFSNLPRLHLIPFTTQVHNIPTPDMDGNALLAFEILVRYLQKKNPSISLTRLLTKS